MVINHVPLAQSGKIGDETDVMAASWFCPLIIVAFRSWSIAPHTGKLIDRERIFRR